MIVRASTRPPACPMSEFSSWRTKMELGYSIRNRLDITQDCQTGLAANDWKPDWNSQGFERRVSSLKVDLL